MYRKIGDRSAELIRLPSGAEPDGKTVDAFQLDEVVELGFRNIFSKPFDLIHFVKDIETILKIEEKPLEKKSWCLSAFVAKYFLNLRNIIKQTHH